MNKKKSVQQIVPAVRKDISHLRTWQAVPAPGLPMIDPFLFLNRQGHQIFSKYNFGLPFGPHPHRGFETVTFILKGDIAHRDSGGGESVIKEGGVQWMTAGRGLIHEEKSSQESMKQGGSWKYCNFGSVSPSN